MASHPPISLLQAKTLALASVSVAPVKRVTLNDAAGRFLADGVSSRRDSPTDDMASIDGWAVASVDLAGAKKERAIPLRKLPLQADRDLKPGEAMKVAAGAAVPFGADAVVRNELSWDDGPRVLFGAEVPPGQNVRRRGEEWPQGELLMPAGHRVDGVSLALLAQLGVTDVAVRPWTRVALFTVAESTLLPALQALVTEAGTEVAEVESCAERDEAIAGTLGRLASRADVVIACPPPALRDAVLRALKSLGGTVGFDGVAMKPGRHAAVGLLNGKAVAILPGPGIATLAAYDHLVRPMLLKRQGVIERRVKVTAKLEAALKKRAGRVLLLPVRLEQGSDGAVASFRGPAAQYTVGALGIEGWVVLPAERTEVHRGDAVEVELRNASRFHALVSNPNDEATR